MRYDVDDQSVRTFLREGVVYAATAGMHLHHVLRVLRRRSGAFHRGSARDRR